MKQENSDEDFTLPEPPQDFDEELEKARQEHEGEDEGLFNLSIGEEDKKCCKSGCGKNLTASWEENKVGFGEQKGLYMCNVHFNQYLRENKSLLSPTRKKLVEE